MQFTSIYTNQPINTDDYLACFVDEYTGEVKEDRRVLEKRVRKLWFRSTMPKAVIHSDVKLSCQQLNAETPPEPSALAHVQILDEGGEYHYTLYDDIIIPTEYDSRIKNTKLLIFI